MRSLGPEENTKKERDERVEKLRLLLDKERTDEKAKEKAEKNAQRELNDPKRDDRLELFRVFNERIKAIIVKFYKDHPVEIARYKVVCDNIVKLNNKGDVAGVQKLNEEVLAFEESLPDPHRNYKLHHSEQFTIYEREHGSGHQSYPVGWDRDYTQEWILLWRQPIMEFFGTKASKAKEKDPFHRFPGLETYKKDRKHGLLSWAFSSDYKSEHVWVDVPKTMLTCHTWRKEYGLEHLESFALINQEVRKLRKDWEWTKGKSPEQIEEYRAYVEKEEKEEAEKKTARAKETPTERKARKDAKLDKAQKSLIRDKELKKEMMEHRAKRADEDHRCISRVMGFLYITREEARRYAQSESLYRNRKDSYEKFKKALRRVDDFITKTDSSVLLHEFIENAFYSFDDRHSSSFWDHYNMMNEMKRVMILHQLYMIDPPKTPEETAEYLVFLDDQRAVYDSCQISMKNLLMEQFVARVEFCVTPVRFAPHDFTGKEELKTRGEAIVQRYRDGKNNKWFNLKLYDEDGSIVRDASVLLDEIHGRECAQREEKTIDNQRRKNIQEKKEENARKGRYEVNKMLEIN